MTLGTTWLWIVAALLGFWYAVAYGLIVLLKI